ncbi:hypothetical protein C8Q72DRAFT_795612 [Fomitopsis betulina]|nr:hypothetical protein C8Q72DRAFT_795612 [Fomitopsis betulina]
MLMLINSNDRTSLAALLTYGWKVIDEEDPKAPAYCNNIYQGGHLKSLHRKSSGIKMIVPLLFVTWFHILQGTKLVSSNILVGAELSIFFILFATFFMAAVAAPIPKPQDCGVYISSLGSDDAPTGTDKLDFFEKDDMAIV